MNIDFADRKLKNLCESDNTARRELGAATAKKLQSRMADILAAERVGDLVVGRPHPLKGDKQGKFSLTLQGGSRLVFEPNMDEMPTDEKGTIDWPEVTSVTIVFIGDYHD